MMKLAASLGELLLQQLLRVTRSQVLANPRLKASRIIAGLFDRLVLIRSLNQEVAAQNLFAFAMSREFRQGGEVLEVRSNPHQTMG